MEQHTAAISQFLQPLLLGIIAYLLARYGSKIERNQDELFRSRNEHEKRLAQHDVRLGNVENEVEYIRHRKGN